MLTGRRAFEGDDVTDVLVAVLSKTPDLTLLPSSTPPAIARLLRRSLERDPRRRLADMADARLELEDTATEPIGTIQSAPTPVVPLWRRVIWPATMAIVAAAFASSVTWMSRPSVARPVSRFAIALAAGDEFTAAESTRGVVAISPDGARIAYMANGRLYIRSRDQLAAIPITGGGASPFFSPDGLSIGFYHDGQLKKVSVNGGAPIVVCDTPFLWGATWTSDDTILYGQGPGGIWRVPATGGKPENIVKLDGGQSAYGPQLLPGGRALLFTLSQGTQPWDKGWDNAQIVVHSLDTGTRRVVVQGGTDARYVSTGHLVYVRERTLLAQPFDVTALAARGAAVPLVDDVAQSLRGFTGAAHFDVGGDGTLVYVPSSSLDLSATSFVWVDRKGQETAVPGSEGFYLAPALSPDGSRVAFNMNSNANSDVWTFAWKRGIFEPVTSDPGRDSDPVWSPDGQRIAYFSTSQKGGPGLFVRAADGTGDAVRLTTGTHVPSSWSRDGERIVYADFGGGAIAATTQADLGVVSLTGERRAEKLLVTPVREGTAVISPDGRWLAYESSETGEKDIFVRPFPDVLKARKRISTAGGVSPVWAKDGRTLFYRNGQAIMEVAVRGAPPEEWGAPQRLFEGSHFFVEGPPMFDVAPDGRFLMLKEVRANQGPQPPKNLIVVQNWTEELKQRVPTD
jgi:serine/threonine-protein kinase